MSRQRRRRVPVVEGHRRAGERPVGRRPGRLRQHRDRLRGHRPRPGLTNTTSATRAAAGTDTDNNAADFTAAAPKPENSSTVTPPPPGDPVAKTIEEIQGNGATSPLDQQSVITKGVVTAAYPTGGFNGYYIQTPGTGGSVDLASHDTSDARVRVRGQRRATYPQIGDYVQVTGKVSEFAGMTELTPASGGVTTLTDQVTAPAPATVGFPTTDASRESLEGMLVAPQGDYTVTDNYTLNQYAEIGLARGTTSRCRSPPTSPSRARPRRRSRPTTLTQKVMLDDGASVQLPHHRQGHPAALPDPGALHPGRRAGHVHPAGDPGLPQQRLEAPADPAAHRRRTPAPCSPRPSPTPARPPRPRSVATSRSPASTC